MATDRLDRSEFVRRMLREFPQVRPLLTGYRTGLHQEMSVFCRFTQAAIDQEDKDLVDRCFRFAASSYQLGTGNCVTRSACHTWKT